jgi:hypothetical protein
MISKLISALQEVQLNMTGEEIADALWLSRYLDKTNLSLSDTSSSIPSTPIDVMQAEEEKITANRVPQHSNELLRNLYPLSEHSTDSAQSGIPFRSPTASALPGSLGIARALRPLMRKIPSHKTFMLDEQATVQRIAEESIWHPVLKPSPTRWFDVALVIDESASMRIWSRTIAAFQYLLEHLGAFRDVRVWRLVTDNYSRIVLYEGKGVSKPFQLPHSPQELLDPSGRRLILIVTDCVSRAWYSGVAQQTVATWSRNSTVSMLQVLPQRLWRRTALSYATPVLLRSFSPNISNDQLKVQTLSPWSSEKPSGGLQLPVVTLEPRLLANWARMIRGSEDVWSPGFVFDDYKQAASKSSSKLSRVEIPRQIITAQERVRRFRTSASPLAQELAELLATAPVSLPVIRLVQQTMLPESRQTHVAEVFLGGLLEETDQASENIALDYIQYEFISGVRDLLLDSVSAHEALRVIKEISRFIENRYGQSLDFLTLLSDPTSSRDLTIDSASVPFAHITAKVLRRIGGRYRLLAEKFEKACLESSTKSINVQEELNASFQTGKAISKKDREELFRFRSRLDAKDIGEWLELRRRNNYQTILVVGSHAGALYRSLPFYNYCQQYTSHNLQTHSLIWSFRECYNVLLQQALGERELYSILQNAFKNVGNLLSEEDEYFAEIVRRGYFREIISTNIDDIAEQALSRVRMIEGRDFEVLIPGEQPLLQKRELTYRLTKVFGDWLSREYTIYNRQSFITDNDELNQYLRSILRGDVLAIGIDPVWDSGILPLLHDTPTTLWFVNGDEDLISNQQIAPILDQTTSVTALGQNYTYEELCRSLYQQLCLEPAQKEKATQFAQPPLIGVGDRSQQGKKAIRVSYIYCDDDLKMMQRFWQHLEVLRLNQLIIEWHRGLLASGDHLQLAQERELRRSQLIFLGFSPNFLSSEYYDQALQALKLGHGETVRLVPLLLHPIGNWKQTPFSQIAPLPREGKTLGDLSSKELDKELSKIADDIHELVKRLQKGEDNR